MKKELLCMAGEIIGELIIGGAIAMITNDSIAKHDNKTEQTIIALGSVIVAGLAGKAFSKEYYKICDVLFDTEFSEESIEE